MTKYYIIAVSVDDHAKGESEIMRYRYAIIKGIIGTDILKVSFFEKKMHNQGEWYSYNPTNGATAKLTVKVSNTGELYMQSESDGTTSNNLLSLPRI